MSAVYGKSCPQGRAYCCYLVQQLGLLARHIMAWELFIKVHRGQRLHLSCVVLHDPFLKPHTQVQMTFWYHLLQGPAPNTAAGAGRGQEPAG